MSINNNTMAPQPRAIDPNRQFVTDTEVDEFIGSALFEADCSDLVGMLQALYHSEDLIGELSAIEEIVHAIASDARSAMERIYNLNGTKEVVREILAQALVNDTLETRSALKTALRAMDDCSAKLPAEIVNGLITLGMPAKFGRRKVTTYGMACYAFGPNN